jgi:biopolymer transport protein ExbD
MDRWDVFVADRLEVLRDLSADEVRAARGGGQVRDDDLVRPSGSSDPWGRLCDHPDLLAPAATARIEPEPAPAPPPPPAPMPPTPAGDFGPAIEDDEEGESPTVEAIAPMVDLGRLDLDLTPPARRVVLPLSGEGAADAPPSFEMADQASHVDDDDDDDEAFGPEDEDDEAAGFTLSREQTETIEEIDLAPMVDVAFQLVLFFLVTATTVLYKTLEVPKPSPEKPPEAAAAQAAPKPQRSLDDLQADFILVGVDPAGTFTVDRQPVPGTFDALAARLRQARADTGRTAMLLTADAAALHRWAVLAYDAANEIGLRIAIARPMSGGVGAARN